MDVRSNKKVTQLKITLCNDIESASDTIFHGVFIHFYIHLLFKENTSLNLRQHISLEYLLINSRGNFHRYNGNNNFFIYFGREILLIKCIVSNHHDTGNYLTFCALYVQ